MGHSAGWSEMEDGWKRKQTVGRTDGELPRDGQMDELHGQRGKDEGSGMAVWNAEQWIE